MNTPKPLLLLFPFEQLAHYLRCLRLAKELAPYFEIRIVHSHRYASFVEEAGFETFTCDGMDADVVLECVKKFDFSWINYKDLKTALDSQIATIEKWKPAVVLGDAVPTLKMATEKTGVPYISLLNGYMSKQYVGVRRMSWRFPLYPFFKFLPEAILNPLTKMGEQQTFYKIHAPFKKLRQHYGLSKKLSYADELEGDLNLICDLAELFPLRPLSHNYQLTPPLIHQPSLQSHDLLKKLDAGKRTLFVSMGSTGDWQQVAFLNEFIFQRYNLITAGDKTGVVHGPHVIALPFANVEQVFPHIDLVLCHGGNGTIYQALQFAIPVLCKTAHFEQEWNVQALRQNNLGASLDAVKTNAGYLQAIETWLDQKGKGPLHYMQQKIREASVFTDVVTRTRDLVLGKTKMVCYNVEEEPPNSY